MPKNEPRIIEEYLNKINLLHMGQLDASELSFLYLDIIGEYMSVDKTTFTSDDYQDMYYVSRQYFCQIINSELITDYKKVINVISISQHMYCDSSVLPIVYDDEKGLFVESFERLLLMIGNNIGLNENDIVIIKKRLKKIITI